MKYFLVLFFVASAGQGVEPQIIEVPYYSMLECWNAGYAFKLRQPKRVVWWNCERIQEADLL